MPPFIRWCRVTVALVLGAGYAFGPSAWRSSPSFSVVNQGPVSVQAWGIIFMACGLLMACTKMIGFALTMFIWLTWGFLIAAAPITSWGQVIWPFFFVLVNGHELAQWGRVRMKMVREQQISSFTEARRLSRERDRRRDGR